MAESLCESLLSLPSPQATGLLSAISQKSENRLCSGDLKVSLRPRPQLEPRPLRGLVWSGQHQPGSRPDPAVSPLLHRGHHTPAHPPRQRALHSQNLFLNLLSTSAGPAPSTPCGLCPSRAASPSRLPPRTVCLSLSTCSTPAPAPCPQAQGTELWAADPAQARGLGLKPPVTGRPLLTRLWVESSPPGHITQPPAPQTHRHPQRLPPVTTAAQTPAAH